MLQRFKLSLVSMLCVVALSFAHAEEGFWTFDAVPKVELSKKYNIEITEKWLDKVRLGSLRFNNGGSGSFVSPKGLVMTNHHVASELLGDLSSKENDLVKNGYLAKTAKDELKVPNLELNQLISIEDVTTRVKAVNAAGLSADEAASVRQKTITAIEKESFEKTGLRSDVIALYRGAEYHLYRYRKFTDVRLVFAPEAEIGFFGGDPDNFMFPRYCLDAAFFRVYENGKAFETPNWFPFAREGAKEGSLTVVSGNPGGTHRLYSVGDLEFSRDVGMPLRLKWLERSAALLHKYAAEGTEQARNAQEEIFGVENSLKDLRGALDGLKNPEIMRRKKDAEEALLKSLTPEARKELEAAFASIIEVRAEFKTYFKEYMLLAEGWGFNSEAFNSARTLVRAARERAKPDGQRERGYNDAERESLEMRLFSTAPYYPKFDQNTLADSLASLKEELGADHAAVKIGLGGKEPAARAAELVGGTKLGDPAERKRVYEGGAKLLAVITDPMIVLARELEPMTEALIKRHRAQDTIETQAYDKIAGAWRDAGGTKRYPDGTFTLRISFGTVKGYEEKGKWLDPFTKIGGLFTRSIEHKNEEPYRVAKSWADAQPNMNLDAPFNFVSTNDIIGGNSGSPVLNAKAEVIGLIFDGNIHSLIGDYYYDETMNRAVAVDIRGILEALRKVYGAKALAEELFPVGGEYPFGQPF